MSQTSNEIISLKKAYCFFEVLFLLRILLRTSAMVVLEESFLGIRFFKNFLADLKISLELLQYFMFV